MTAQQRSGCSLVPAPQSSLIWLQPVAGLLPSSMWGQGITPELSSGASRVTGLLPPSLLIKSPRGSVCWSAGPAGCGLQWIIAQAQRAPSQADCSSKSLEEHQSQGDKVTRTGTQREHREEYTWSRASAHVSWFLPWICRSFRHMTAKGELRLQRQWPGSRTVAVTCPEM